MRRCRTAAQRATLAFIVHGIVAVSILGLDRTTAGANVGGWDAVRLLRLAELPVLWAIDWLLQHFQLVPPGCLRGDFALQYWVNLVATYVLVGGALYATLTAGLSLWLGRFESEV